MKVFLPLVAAALVLVSVTAHAQAAITCIVNKKSGQFESPDKSKDPAQVQELCATQVSLDILGAFAEAENSVEQGGTKVISGVIVTNLNDVTSQVSAALRARRAREQDRSYVEQKKAAEVQTWEILETDGTLQKTIERWASVAGWQVVWEDIPNIKNVGRTSLPGRTFISAVDYVLFKAQRTAASAGFVLKPVTYPNNVLVISKEEQK